MVFRPHVGEALQVEQQLLQQSAPRDGAGHGRADLQEMLLLGIQSAPRLASVGQNHGTVKPTISKPPTPQKLMNFRNF